MGYKIKRDNRGIHIGLGGVTDKVGFHGVTPVEQRSGVAGAAVATTGAAMAQFGYTQAQANALVTLVNELRATLVASGLHKGSA